MFDSVLSRGAEREGGVGDSSSLAKRSLVKSDRGRTQPGSIGGASHVCRSPLKRVTGREDKQREKNSEGGRERGKGREGDWHGAG